MQALHGILNPRAAEGRFELARFAPGRDLAPFVERYWLVRWDLRDRPPYSQETLPYPCVNLVIGTHRPGVHGPAKQRFVAELCDQGWVFGIKFRPAGLCAFTTRPMADLVDRDRPVSELFGSAGLELEREVHAARDAETRVEIAERFLRARSPERDPDAERVSSIVDLVEAAPEIARVAELAARSEVPVRTLERLFRRYVGVTPKWVIRRFRVQQAAARAADGHPVPWSQLAHDLGYFDQAHFIRDFKAQVGRTPREYAAWCAERAPCSAHVGSVLPEAG